MADKKLRFALLNRFKKNLQMRGKNQEINLYSQQWAADAMIESYGYDKCVEIIDHYCLVSSSPDWNWFAYNSEKVLQAKQIEDEDAINRQILRQKAKKWLEG